MEHSTVGPRRSGITIGAGGLLIAIGAELHPRDLRDDVEQTLASYFQAPTWDASHLLIMVGLWVGAAGLILARRDGVFARRLDRQLLITAACWLAASIELVPHLLARHDLDALQHHQDTPVLDVHLLLAVAATPLFGFTAAWLAITVALTERTWPARLLALPGVVGGVAYGAAGPLIYFTDNVAVAPLFAGQGVAAVFVLGTGVRLLIRRAGRTARESSTRSQAAPA